jgi:hypothetical protein
VAGVAASDNAFWANATGEHSPTTKAVSCMTRVVR